VVCHSTVPKLMSKLSLSVGAILAQLRLRLGLKNLTLDPALVSATATLRRPAPTVGRHMKLLAVTRVTIVTRYLASVRVSLVYTRVTTYDELRNLVDFSARLVSFYIRPSSENKIF
jgi:hypothetical protein